MSSDESGTRERLMLHQLAVQLRNEDPQLARRLSHGGPAIGARFSPGRWPRSLHLTLGLLFLGTGVWLGVLSSIALGLTFLAAAAVRWARTRADGATSAVALETWGPGAGPPPRRLT